MTARHALKFTTNQRCYSDFFRALMSVWIGLVTGKILTALWKPLNILWNLSVTNHFLSSQPSVRKTHNGGRKHKENVRFYYTKWMEEQAQSLIDQTSMQLFFFSVQLVDEIQNSVIHEATVNVKPHKQRHGQGYKKCIQALVCQCYIYMTSTNRHLYLKCNELNRGHQTFFCQSQDELRTKESEFVHFGSNANEVKSDWELMRKTM